MSQQTSNSLDDQRCMCCQHKYSVYASNRHVKECWLLPLNTVRILYIYEYEITDVKDNNDVKDNK